MKQPSISYSSSQLRQRSQQFGQRKIISSKFMSQSTLEKMDFFEEVQSLLDRIGIFHFAFEPFPTYPSLVIEFLSTFTLRTQFIDYQNPFYGMKFKLGGRNRFLTPQQFDAIFGFCQGGLDAPNSLWSPTNFWINIPNHMLLLLLRVTQKPLFLLPNPFGMFIGL